MSQPTTLHDQGQPIMSVALSLQDVLTNTYNLLLATHNAHWNIEGQNFLPLHTLLETHYNEQFKALDLIAERIRALGDYVQPFDSGNAASSKAAPLSSGQDADADMRAHQMVNGLIVLTEAVIKSCQFAKEEAQEEEDDESEGLMIERIYAHQKSLWLLRSTLR